MRKTTLGAAAAILFAACVSPSGAQKAPAWIMGAPRPDATHTYFTAEATDQAGDRAKAADAAVNAVIATVVKYLGVTVKAEFEGESLATLDSYGASMKQSVTVAGSARFAGFTVAEIFYAPSKQRKSKAVTAYVLVKYETAEMEKERARLQALIDEQQALVLAPERDGGAALAEGRDADAARLFLQAAAGAASLAVDNREVKIRRNLDKALNAIAGIRLTRASAPERVVANRAPGAPFVVKAQRGGEGGTPVRGAPLVATYQRKQASGRLVGRTEGLATAADGTAAFALPPLDYVGESKLTFALESGAMREYLDALPGEFSAQADAIGRELAGKAIDVAFSIASDAKAHPVGVAIADVGETGTPEGSAAQRAALEELLAQGFSASALVVPVDALAKGDGAAIIAAAKAASPARIVYGTAAVSETKKDGGAYVASCRISLAAIDAASGALLAACEKTVKAIGTTEADAKRAAWKAAGSAALKELLPKLP